HESFLTDTTDESFEETHSLSKYSETFKQRQYILVLNEFDSILFNKAKVHNMDNEFSLDERLLLSSIKYYDNCPVESLLQPFVFSDQTYSEIRKWRRSIIVKKEYFSSQIIPEDHPTEENIFQRDLGVFLVNLRETLDRQPLRNNKKQPEMDFLVQNVSILLRFVFNSKSKVVVSWYVFLIGKKIHSHIFFLIGRSFLNQIRTSWEN
ncbi:hypothetical protein BDF14DRAFT_1733432, partial [Spinellus fusiger]